MPRGRGGFGKSWKKDGFFGKHFGPKKKTIAAGAAGTGVGYSLGRSNSFSRQPGIGFGYGHGSHYGGRHLHSKNKDDDDEEDDTQQTTDYSQESQPTFIESITPNSPFGWLILAGIIIALLYSFKEGRKKSKKK
jgi:hypothetical protein